MRKLILVAVAACSLLWVQQAGAVEKQGSAAMKFLTLDVSARQSALGTAYSALTDVGALGLLTNQASMVFSEGIALGFTHTVWLADMNYEAGAVTFSLGDMGVIGVSFQLLSSGDMTLTTSQDPLGVIANTTFNVSDMAVGIGYAKRLTDSFSAGGVLKYVNEATGGNVGKAEDVSVTGVALDFSTLYTTDFHGFRIGTSLLNFGPDLNFTPKETVAGKERNKGNIKFPLPTALRMGFAVEPVELPMGKFTVLAEVAKPKDLDTIFNTGAEWWVNDYIAARVGWKFGYSGTQDEGISAGAGLRFNQGTYSINADYAFTSFDRLDDVHRFSIGIGF